MREYNCLPYVARFPAACTRPGSWRRLWEEAGEAAFVLESGKNGRYTFVGPQPVEWISGGLNEAEWCGYEKGRRTRTKLSGPPLAVLRRWMAGFRAPRVERAPKFTGGIVGYLAYDVVRTLEKIPEKAAADAGTPDYFFMRTDRLWIVDHEDKTLYCAVYAFREKEERWSDDELRERYHDARRAAEEMKRAWDRWSAESAPTIPDEHMDIDIERIRGLSLSLPKDRFMAAAEKVKQYIASGDVYQVNLSLRQSKPLAAPPERIYEVLRAINPSPYMAFLRLPDGSRIASASPELLVKLEGSRISTRPIAGTRPRGADAGEDGKYREEMLLSEKERAEHIMLVDLERNDLGKICDYGTVKVKELMTVEHYSHVMHIVSEVEGKVAERHDAFSCIAAVFPGGTITGAPKIRTMEIIEELEPVRRGIYTGSIGWIDYNGNMELNIVIRTLVYKDGTAYVQSGAGIVIDSDPEKEFYESLNKAKALWKAVEIGERTGDPVHDSGH